MTAGQRWFVWAVLMGVALGGIFGFLTAPWGVFPR